jgi:endonuclease YncB( thermonuclease family)
MTNQTNTQTLNKTQYQQLKTDLQNLFEQGINKTNQQATNQLTKTYWQIGQRIATESITNQSGYLGSILKTLSNELKIERSTLSRCINFYKTYATTPNNPTLSWSHYRELMTIKDQPLRTKLEHLATNKSWSREKLISAIKQNKNNPNQEPKLTRPTKPTYLYKAKIIEVIDGDTIIININLGFQIHKEQRIRLAKINCPEITTNKGQDSFHFLLKKATKIKTLMIKTKKIDIYGRYLGHIFYDPNPEQNKFSDDDIFAKGVYLNEEIVNEGFGEVF